jgi:hypothetical protein
MGPMLLTGLVCFGATVAIGLVASSTSRPTRPIAGVPPALRLAIILVAFAAGSAVMGFVIGLLAVEMGAVSGPLDGLLAALPAMAGGSIGLGMIMRQIGQMDRQAAMFGAVYIVGLAVLGAVLAVLAFLTLRESPAAQGDWPFVLLGLASGAAALGIGVSGSRSIRSIEGADETTATAIVKRQIRRVVPLQAVAVSASAIAILLVVRV